MLPIRSKGLGIHELEDRRYAEFIGGAVQGISSLMDRKKNEDGVMIKGRVQTPSLKAWLGEGSFDCDNPNPWRVLMSRDSRIGKAIHNCWTHMSQDFRTTCVRAGLAMDEKQILLNSSERAGFDHDGCILHGSVTRILTSNLEGVRFKLLKKSVDTKTQDGSLYEPTTRERLVFNSTDIFSCQPITALPCPLGIMPDDSFAEIFATYLGLPSPAMRAFTLDPDKPYFIGRSGREQRVDKYGDVVARAEVKGGDFRRSHEELKIVLNGMLKHAGFYTTLEARNIFQGRIAARYLHPYCTQHSNANEIIPDILIHNYKDDSGSSRATCLPAIIDLKTLRVDKNGVFYTAGVHGGRAIKRAVEKKSNQVRTNYKSRVGRLDDKFAPNDQHRPFTTAYTNTFATGGIMPVICGAFGDMNKETHQLVVKCAKHAATKQDNSEEVSSAKGSPYSSILSQF